MTDRFISRYFLARNGLIGAAFLRVALASIEVVNYLWHLGIRGALWGPHGQIDYATYMRDGGKNIFALYRVASTAALTDAIIFASLAIAVLYAAGFAPRVLCWPFAITAYATMQRNMPATDAGQMLLVLIAFLLCVMDTSRYFTLFPSRKAADPDALTTIAANVLHNAGRFLVAWQICMVYYWAAFYKVSGIEWRTGTAMSYVLSLHRFEWFPGLSSLLAHDGAVMAFASYFTLAFQGAFPFLMWNQRIKPFLVAGAIMLHTGIALLMGLVSFSATMVAVDASILSDHQILVFARHVRSFVKTAWTRSSAALGSRYALPTGNGDIRQSPS